jgi:Fe-S-cluster containining protein
LFVQNYNKIIFLAIFANNTSFMECRPDCGACCIALSVSSPIPGLPEGKEVGVKCIHLTDDYKCAIYDDPQRPKSCAGFFAEAEFCGSNREEALRILYSLSDPPTGAVIRIEDLHLFP